MLLVLEFLLRTLDSLVNLPVPCSLCLQSGYGDRKVVTLNRSYRQPDTIAVRHWYLSDCTRNCSLPGFTETLVSYAEVTGDPSVILPDHCILAFNATPIPNGQDTFRGPITAKEYNNFYDGICLMQEHAMTKDLWVFREFVKVYLPYLCDSSPLDERVELEWLMNLAATVKETEPDLWLKWNHWRRYLTHFKGLPGELVFGPLYGTASFSFGQTVRQE